MLNLINGVNHSLVYYIGVIFAFAATLLFTKLFKNKLPRDGGREFAVDGKLSAGKPRGAGIIFVLVFAVAALLFGDVNIEYGIYIFIVIATMLTGFFDDASSVPWNEYKKGILDLLLAVAVAVTFLFYNDHTATLVIADFTFGIHPVVFGILTVILVWTSINVTNCTDGVDGLSAYFDNAADACCRRCYPQRRRRLQLLNADVCCNAVRVSLVQRQPLVAYDG